MPRVNKTRFAVLGMLSIEPMSGYDMKCAMRDSTAHFWAESDGQLYPILAQLLKEGLVTCDTKQSVSARPRKVYTINKKGVAELKGWLLKAPEKLRVRDELMLKLFFGSQMPVEGNIKHIRRQEEKITEKLDVLKSIEKQLKKCESDSLNYPYWQVTLKYGIRIAEAKLKWCKEAVAMLTGSKKN